MIYKIATYRADGDILCLNVNGTAFWLASSDNHSFDPSQLLKGNPTSINEWKATLMFFDPPEVLDLDLVPNNTHI